MKKKRDKKSVYVTLYPKIDSRQENTKEHESDLRNNEHYLGNSENKAWKKTQACTEFESKDNIPIALSIHSDNTKNCKNLSDAEGPRTFRVKTAFH